MSNQSGWYEDDNGNPFHVLGENMSDETIQALRKLAWAAYQSADKDELPNSDQCRYCGSANTERIDIISHSPVVWACQCRTCGKFFEIVAKP